MAEMTCHGLLLLAKKLGYKFENMATAVYGIIEAQSINNIEATDG